MRYYEIVENVQPAYLYHGTGLRQANSILKSNRLINPSRRANPDRPYQGGQIMGISLTRDPIIAELYGYVVFVIDAEKLRQRMKPVPYDYDYHARIGKDGKFRHVKNSYFVGDEFEEVIPGGISPLEPFLVSIYPSPSRARAFQKWEKSGFASFEQSDAPYYRRITSHPKYRAWEPRAAESRRQTEMKRRSDSSRGLYYDKLIRGQYRDKFWR